MSEKYVSFAEKPMDLSMATEKQPTEPYYPSISVPIEAFEGETPKVGSKVNFSIQCEVEEVRKDKRTGISTRLKVLSGCVDGDVTDEEFEDMDADSQDKEIKKVMDKNQLEEY